MNLENNHKILSLIATNPNMTQREMAESLHMSLGKANYCVRLLAERGWIKIKNFKNSKNKLAYAYLLTPAGIEQKAHLTRVYLESKMKEYDELKKEIEELRLAQSPVAGQV